jgi:hypothetical protein
MTTTIDNAPARNNRGIDEGNRAPAVTVNGSLLKKPVTLAAANLGSCEKNPGKAYTTIDMGAIFEKEGGSLKSWFDPRGDEAKSGRGADKGGIRPAAGKHSKNLKNVKTLKNLKSSARQGALISQKIRDDPQTKGAMYGNSGGSTVSEGMSNKDNCGGTGTKELNILPIKCKAFLFDMGISTASFFLSNEVGELATKYQAWHKLTADENQSAGRPASQITTGCARIYLVKCATKSEIHLRLKMGQFKGN